MDISAYWTNNKEQAARAADAAGERAKCLAVTTHTTYKVMIEFAVQSSIAYVAAVSESAAINLAMGYCDGIRSAKARRASVAGTSGQQPDIYPGMTSRPILRRL